MVQSMPGFGCGGRPGIPPGWHSAQSKPRNGGCGDAGAVGSLIGVKTVVNEFVAYLQLAGTLESGALSPRAAIVATYALLGFANFSSIAIQIGGIGGIAPARRSDLSRLGLRAMIGGNLAAFMSACLAGMLL